MNLGRYREILASFAGRRVVVLGDLMMDEYLWGRATRISPESPVMVVEVERETRTPGGAANVVNNLLSLGAAVAVVGVVGDDPAGEQLKAHLAERGADVQGVAVDPSRPTTRKTRVVAHSQQVLRVDREQTHPISAVVERRLAQAIRHSHGAEAVIVSDYNKGVLTPQVASAAVLLSAEAGVLLTANPKPANARHLAGARVVQLNQSEAQATANDRRFDDGDGFRQAGQDLVRELAVGTLVVTQGPNGLTLFHADGTVCHVPPHRVAVYDACGAGDTVISTMTLGLAGGATPEEAAFVGSRAAACVVRKVGVETTTVDEILAEWSEP